MIHPEGRIVVALDPGETTGFAVFRGVELIEFGQLIPGYKDPSESAKLIDALIKRAKADLVVYESYRVYSFKTDSHAWNEMYTSQVIGTIRFMCNTGVPEMKVIPTFPQTAQVAKQFVTDEKLKAWNMYARGQKHARDAIRHGCWFILFGEEKWLREQSKA